MGTWCCIDTKCRGVQWVLGAALTQNVIHEQTNVLNYTNNINTTSINTDDSLLSRPTNALYIHT